MKNVIITILMVFVATLVHAEQCDDPGLKPNLKKACYQMEKMCKEIGCAVSVR